MTIQDLDNLYEKKIILQYKNKNPETKYYIIDDIGYIEVYYNYYTPAILWSISNRYKAIYITNDGKSYEDLYDKGYYTLPYKFFDPDYHSDDPYIQILVTSFKVVNIDKDNQLFVVINNKLVYLTDEEKEKILYGSIDRKISNKSLGCYHKDKDKIIIQDGNFLCTTCMNILEGSIHKNNITSMPVLLHKMSYELIEVRNQ
jgi:hypothetical protein